MMNELENWRYAAYNHNYTTNLILVTAERDVCSIAQDPSPGDGKQQAGSAMPASRLSSAAQVAGGVTAQ